MSAISKAYQFYQAGRHSEAETTLLAYLKHQKRDPKAYHLLAIILKSQRRYDEAGTAIDRAQKLAPSDLNIRLEKAQILRDAGRVEEAVKVAERLLLRSAGQPHASLIAGNYWLSKDYPEKALELFETALRANPGHRHLAISRVFALKDLCRFEEAEQAFQTLGSPPELFFTMGQLHMENFQSEKAIDFFRKSLMAGQNMTMSARNLWQCHYMTGGRAALDRSINELLSSYPDQAGFYIQIADMMTDLGDTDEALAVIERFEKRFGPQPAADRVKAAAYQRAGDSNRAYKFAQAALTKMPDDPQSAMYLAKILLSEGRQQRAFELAETYLQKDDDQRSFWLAIKATALRLIRAEEEYHALVDYDRMLGVYDLEAPAGYASIEAFMLELKGHLLSLHEWNEQPLFQSLRQGTQTTRDLRHDQAPVMRAFFQAIDSCIRDYMAKMPDDESHPFYGRRTGGYRISGAWSVALKPGGFHVEHIHPKGWISSSFYVDVPDSVADHPEQAGWIKFGKPPFDRVGLEAEKYICPKPGRLVLFPSYFWHGTVPFTEGERRITLPFDLMPLD